MDRLPLLSGIMLTMNMYGLSFGLSGEHEFKSQPNILTSYIHLTTSTRILSKETRWSALWMIWSRSKYHFVRVTGFGMTLV